MSQPFGVVTLWEFGDPERVRDVLKARHTSRAQRSAPARFAGLRMAAHAAACWLRGRVVQTRGARRVHGAQSLASDSALVE
jgi:hypothetical protein